MTQSLVLALNRTYPATPLGFCPLADAPAQWSFATLLSSASESLDSGIRAVSETLSGGVSKTSNTIKQVFRAAFIPEPVQKPCNWPKVGKWDDWKREAEFRNGECWNEFNNWKKIERISDFEIFSPRSLDNIRYRIHHKYINGWFQTGDVYDNKEIYQTRYKNSQGKIYEAAVLTENEYTEEKEKCAKNDRELAEKFTIQAPNYYFSKHEHRIYDQFYTGIKSRWGDKPQACKFEALRQYYGFGLELPDLPDLVRPRKYLLDEPELSQPKVAIEPYVDQLNRWYDQYQTNMAQAQEQLETKGLAGWDEFEAFQLDGHLANAWEDRQSGHIYMDYVHVRHGLSYSEGAGKSAGPCWNLPQEPTPALCIDGRNCPQGTPEATWAEYLKKRAFKNEEFEYRGARIPCFTKDSADRVPSVETLVRWRLEDYNIWKAFREKVQDLARTNGTKIVEDFEKCLIEKNDKIYKQVRFKNDKDTPEPADLVYSKWKEEFDKFYFDNFVLEETHPLLRLAGGENGYSSCYNSKTKPPIPTPPEPKPSIPAPPDDSNLVGRVALGALVTGAVGAAAYALWPKRPKAPTPQPEEKDDIEALSPRPAVARSYYAVWPKRPKAPTPQPEENDDTAELSPRPAAAQFYIERTKTSAEKRLTSFFDLQEPHSASQSLDRQPSTAGI